MIKIKSIEGVKQVRVNLGNVLAMPGEFFTANDPEVITRLATIEGEKLDILYKKSEKLSFEDTLSNSMSVAAGQIREFAEAWINSEGSESDIPIQLVDIPIGYNLRGKTVKFLNTNLTDFISGINFQIEASDDVFQGGNPEEYFIIYGDNNRIGIDWGDRNYITNHIFDRTNYWGQGTGWLMTEIIFPSDRNFIVGTISIVPIVPEEGRWDPSMVEVSGKPVGEIPIPEKLNFENVPLGFNFQGKTLRIKGEKPLYLPSLETSVTIQAEGRGTGNQTTFNFSLKLSDVSIESHIFTFDSYFIQTGENPTEEIISAGVLKDFEIQLPNEDIFLTYFTISGGMPRVFPSDIPNTYFSLRDIEII